MRGVPCKHPFQWGGEEEKSKRMQDYICQKPDIAVYPYLVRRALNKFRTAVPPEREI